jgi:DNA-binding ferritin-like protein
MSSRTQRITRKPVRKNRKTIKNTATNKPKAKKHQLNQAVRRQIIHDFLTILNCVKVYHWSTGSYSQHKATDMLYEELNKHIDGFVEIMLAKTNKRINNIQTSRCNIPNKVEFVKKMKGFKKILYGLNKYMDPVVDSNLYNIRDEMLGVVDQLLYLFELK